MYFALALLWTSTSFAGNVPSFNYVGIQSWDCNIESDSPSASLRIRLEINNRTPALFLSTKAHGPLTQVPSVDELTFSRKDLNSEGALILMKFAKADFSKVDHAVAYIPGGNPGGPKVALYIFFSADEKDLGIVASLNSIPFSCS